MRSLPFEAYSVVPLDNIPRGFSQTILCNFHCYIKRNWVVIDGQTARGYYHLLSSTRRVSDSRAGHDAPCPCLSSLAIQLVAMSVENWISLILILNRALHAPAVCISFVNKLTKLYGVPCLTCRRLRASQTGFNLASRTLNRLQFYLDFLGTRHCFTYSPFTSQVCRVAVISPSLCEASLRKIESQGLEKKGIVTVSAASVLNVLRRVADTFARSSLLLPRREDAHPVPLEDVNNIETQASLNCKCHSRSKRARLTPK